MNLFRSEEHVERWLGDREPGSTIPVAKLSELAFKPADDGQIGLVQLQVHAAERTQPV